MKEKYLSIADFSPNVMAIQRLRSRVRMPGDQTGEAITVEPSPEGMA